jgi:hypothetical protein
MQKRGTRLGLSSTNDDSSFVPAEQAGPMLGYLFSASSRHW